VNRMRGPWSGEINGYRVATSGRSGKLFLKILSRTHEGNTCNSTETCQASSEEAWVRWVTSHYLEHSTFIRWSVTLSLAMRTLRGGCENSVVFRFDSARAQKQ
jgi:hypothetical protein